MENRNSLWKLVCLVILLTVGTFLFSYVAYVLDRNVFPSSLIDLWNRWDTAHYLDIAERGYSDIRISERHLRIVFFPFYPLLIKLFALVFQNYLFSALLVSNLSYVIASIYLYKLASVDYPEEASLRAVFFFSIFPTAYFLHAGYTEGTYLALTISSFYYARKERWWLSCTIGMMATATRITGIVLVPALLAEYLAQKEFKIRNLGKDVLWLALVPIGFLSYLTLNYLVYDYPLKFLEFQREHWHEKAVFPWQGFLGAWEGIWRVKASAMTIYGWAQVISAILGLLFTVYSFFYFRISYSIYMLLTLLIVTSASFWISLPRFVVTMFPMFIAFSLVGKREEVNYIIVFLSILFYGLFLALFVQGRWAF
ncbi:MAG TPA: glycosyltransferase family 39 protein [Thermodesulfobacteriota bacterium]|nr:glycosyltransferase family 39 protein [Thermodesulfobacteriota bacterium]